MRGPISLIAWGLFGALIGVAIAVGESTRPDLTCKPGLVLVKNFYGDPVCVPGQPPEAKP